MPELEPQAPEVPEARITGEKSRFSLVWIVPIAAALVGLWVAIASILQVGPEITIDFKSAEGLEAGKTKIHFNGVDVGTIQTIRLTADHQRVITTARMARKSEGILVDGTKFWIVRPRISGASITGLGTLISGPFVGMEIGSSTIPKREFVALDTPPVIAGDVPGRFFVLKARDLGSLDVGTPVFYRRLQVGEVVSYELDKGGGSLSIELFVRAPYDAYVTSNSRFWQASGIDVSLSASGMSVQTQSLLSILIGGVAFENPAGGPPLPEAEAKAVFTLFGDRAAAFEPADSDPQTFVLAFRQSVRGLQIGAPVEFQGIPIGKVVDIRAQLDLKASEFSVFVTVRLDAAKLGVEILNVEPQEDRVAANHRLVESLVSNGLRARLRSANLLTGSLIVSLEFVPDAPAVAIDWSQEPAQMPTAPGDLEGIEARIARIVEGLESMPFHEIGDDMKQAVLNLGDLLASARKTIDSIDEIIRPGSALAEEATSSLHEVSHAARSLRLLVDYLERHPEALLRGKSGKDQ